MAFERRRVRCMLGLSYALLLAMSSTAHAEPDAVTKELARTFMNKGKAQRKQNDLKGAMEQFRSAHEIMHVPTTALELARTQAMLGLLAQAVETLRQASQTPQ